MVGFDVDARKPEALQRGESYIRHIGAERVARAFGRGRISGDDRLRRPRRLRRDHRLRADAARPPPRARPLLHPRHGRRDRRRDCARGSWWCSSRPPTPARRARSCCRASSRAACSRASTSSSRSRPSARTPGTRASTPRTSPRSWAGSTRPRRRSRSPCTPRRSPEVVPVSSPEVAEAAKLLENIFRAVNIALANEMKLVLDRMGINVWEVIEAAKTKPFGFMPFYPGPGLGGHCIPLDPFYLDLEGGGARRLGALHRARGRDQHLDAALRRRPHGARAQPPRQEHQGLAACWCSGCRTRPTSTTTASRRPSRSSSCCARAAPRSRTATLTSPSRAPAASTTSSCARCPAPRRSSPATTRCSSRPRTRTSATPPCTAQARLVVDTRNVMAPLGYGARGAAGPEVVRA